MAVNIDNLAQLLNATLDAKEHRKGTPKSGRPALIVNLEQRTVKYVKHFTKPFPNIAENALKEEAKKPKYSLALLSIVSTDGQALKTRLAAALAFKNFIRHNYVDEEGNYKLPLDEVNTIKQELVGLMISSPSTIQTQLGEAISIIADSDFWERWDTLTKVGRRPWKPNNSVGLLTCVHI